MSVAPKYDLQVFPTSYELNSAAVAFIIEAANEAIGVRGHFSIALSGGHTPEQLYALLAEAPYCDQMPWEKTFVFWGDERCVPIDDKRNNAYMAKLALLDKVNIPIENIHPIPINLTPADAAKKYEEELNIFFKDEPKHFDLILLGLGTNGHTASLFPGTPVVNEQTVGIREVYLPDDKMYRITMTAPLINLACNILFLVTGTEKTAILKAVLTGHYTPTLYPAQLIQPPEGILHWFADREAGGDLK